jgi:exopolysaccharide production protein ExoZ
MRTIVSVQALRAVAALSVVLCHFDQIGLSVQGRSNDPAPLYSLSSGVDLFFIISGFIMVYSSEDFFGKPGAWKTFLSRRIVRVVPLYWIATAVAIPMMSLTVNWENLLGSLLFIPYRTPNDNIFPLHGVGWTLNFEMFFYAIFSTAICWPRKIAVPLVCLMLCTIVVAGHLFPPHNAIMAYWSDPIILEFAFGMIIGLFYIRGFKLPLAMRIFFIAAGVTAVWFSIQHMPPSRGRVLFWGIPAAMVFAGTVLGKQPDFGRLTSFVRLMGDSSYALYLIHPLIGAAIFVAWQWLNNLPLEFVLSTAVLLAIVISIAVWATETALKKSINKFTVRRVVLVR